MEEVVGILTTRQEFAMGKTRNGKLGSGIDTSHLCPMTRSALANATKKQLGSRYNEIF